SKPPRARRRRARRRSGAPPERSNRRGDDLGPAGDPTDGGGGGRFAVGRSGDRARRRPRRPAGREPPADRGARHGARPGGRSARVGRGPLPRRPLRRRRRRRSGPLRGRRAGPRPPSPARHLAGRANGGTGARARTAGGRVAGARHRRRRPDRDREMTDLLRSRRALVWFLALGLAASGALLVTRMPSGIYPEMDFPRIVVVARSGDAPAELTQATLGRPLEVALATVQGIERVRSRAIRGAVEISLLFAPGTDMWRALQLTESRVGETRSALPAGADVVVERLTTTSFPVITFNVTGPVDSRRLRDLGELVLRPAISRVRGVGRVEVLGGDVREIEIILDPARTAALKLSPTRIAEKVRDASVLQAVGRFDDAHALVTVMASGEPHEASDLGRIPVAVGTDGSPVPLSAIATIEEGAEDRLLRVSAPEGDTVLVSVSRLPGASTPDVVSEVRTAVAQTAHSFPTGVAVKPVYDQAVLVDESMRSVRDAILIGIVLCVGVIALFLRDLRAGLVASLAVPITLGIAFIPVHVAGQSLNLMSLGALAIAIGLVVDDAIVVVEALRRRLEQGDPIDRAASGAVRDLRSALLGTTITTVIVFVPLAWLQGIVGRFFQALAGT